MLAVVPLVRMRWAACPHYHAGGRASMIEHCCCGQIITMKGEDVQVEISHANLKFDLTKDFIIFKTLRPFQLFESVLDHSYICGLEQRWPAGL